MEIFEEKISHAAKVVRDGGIIIFPTDTAYGIGCRVDNQQAVSRLFEIRRRPLAQPTPVLVSSVVMAREWFGQTSDLVEKLMDRYWPGALTIIAPCRNPLVAKLVCGPGPTIGLRQPDHETALEIISRVGVPILGPSANFHGGPTPFSVAGLNPELVKLVDAVIDGETRASGVSTVADCTGSHPLILRQGAVRL